MAVCVISYLPQSIFVGGLDAVGLDDCGRRRRAATVGQLLVLDGPAGGH